MNNLKEHIFPYESFIGGWYIDEKICDDIIKHFNENKKYVTLGKSGKNEVIPDKKMSFDLPVTYEINQKYPFNEYCKCIAEIIKNYEKKYEALKHIDNYGLISGYNIQYYEPKGGYKIWHCENDSYKNMNRVLVFMTYLNNVPDGGTKFMYQNLISPAIKGLTLLWPSSFTHTHMGQITENNEKYIVTGWLNYLPKENLK
jgi:hypothetical protein